MKNNLLRQIIMLSKLTIYGVFLQCLFIGMLMADDLEAQNVRSVREVKIKLDQKVYVVKAIFDKIEASTNFYFSYYPDDIDINQIVSVNSKNQRVSDVLLQISKETDLSFRQINNNINVRKKAKNGTEETIEVIIQGVTITGKISSSEDGTSIPGVNVIVKGTNTGTVTDIDGNYTLEVPDVNAVLVFSSVGYVTQEVTVGNRTVIDLTMKPDITALQEVVVIGYGTVKKRDLTGAIVSLDEKDLTTGAAITSVSQMLQGRAAGVEVSANDGLPGQQLNIIIRGANSISNSNQPLYVVDGFPMPAGVSIAPEDIATIDILKDAASSAIYGSRGSSGVILITTKKGKRGQTSIDLDAYVGTQSMIGDIPYLDWDDHARIVNEQYALGVNDGNPWYSAEDLATGAQNNTKWLDQVTQNAIIQNYTLRASGANDKGSFALSGTYFDQDGIFISTGFRRMSVRLNADYNFSERVKIGVNMYTARLDGDMIDRRPGSRSLSPLYAIMSASPGRAAYNDDGTLAHTVFSRDTRRWLNPIGLFTERIGDYNAWRTYTNMNINYEIIDNLVARVNAGFDHSSGYTGQYQPQEFSIYGTDPFGSIDESKSNTYLVEGTINYNLEFSGGKHSLNFLVGTSYQYDDYFSFSLTGLGFPTDKTLYFNLGSAANQSISSYKNDQTLVSFFGRVGYSFNDRVLVTATMRSDGASQFGDNNKWGSFPSVSAAWRLSDEAFLSGSSFVSDLKLRASYGITGNNAISPYTSLARVGPTYKVYSYDGQSSSAGLGSDGIFAPNPDLRWETTKMYNFGLDFGFFENRIYGSLELYNSTTDDLIIDKPISSASTGYSVIRTNVGSIENKGVELTLGGRILTGAFKWTIDGNFSKNKNKILKLADENPIVLEVPRQPYGEIGEYPYRQIIEGGEMGEFFGYVFAGVLQPGEVYAPQPNTVKPGTALFEDLNGDGIIDSDDRTVIGNAYPDYIWGVNNHFEFKGLYLDMFWQGAVGNDVLNFKAIALDRSLTTKALDRWSPTNPEGTRPGTDWFEGEYGSYINTAFIEDGSYVRLKNVTLGYNFNMKNVTWLQNLHLYVQGQNLLTFTDYTGFDPEFSFDYAGTQNALNRGVDDFGYPNFKTYTVGLKVTF